MKSKIFLFIILLLLVSITIPDTFAQEKKKIPIPTLFNTGVNDNNILLDDGETDPHYRLIISSDQNFPGPDTKVVYSNGFPMDCWLQNDSKSKWIAPRADAGESDTPGAYVYNLGFSLYGFKPETADIKGFWTSDNNGVDILINNKSCGFTTGYNAFASGFYPFEIKQGFIEGINTISFMIYNGEAPTGLRVVIYGEAEPKEFVDKKLNDSN